MIEINIPKKTIDVLLDHVYTKVPKENIGTFPFYINVTPNLMQRAFGDFLDLSVVTTGYIYAHDEPIPLHVDRFKKDSVYNLCVPLQTKDTNQKFIVFDQIFDICGCEWQMAGVSQKRHQPASDDDRLISDKDNDHIESRSYNGVRPCDTDDVQGLTTVPVNSDVIKYLPFDKSFYFGMTGTAWPWIPTKGLIFKSSRLHTTGYQTEFKIGCVLLMTSEDCLLNQ